jgi:hypothetical protein
MLEGSRKIRDQFVTNEAEVLHTRMMAIELQQVADPFQSVRAPSPTVIRCGILPAATFFHS